MGEWQGRKSLIEANNYMLRNEVACDVEFLVGDSKDEVRAHRYVLMARSPVLMHLLMEHHDENKITIVVADVTVEALRDTLTYLYTENVDIHADNVTALLKTSRKFEIQGLVKLCCAYLDSSMEVTNVCKIMEQSHSYKENALYKKCVSFILEYAFDVLKTSGFSELCPECVMTLIKSDNLKINEELVFEAMMIWSGNECQRKNMTATDANRRDVLGELLYQIRFPTMEVSYFTQNVSFRDILSNDEAIAIFQYFHGEERQLVNKFKVNKRHVSKLVKPFSKLKEHGENQRKTSTTVSEGNKKQNRNRNNVSGKYTQKLNANDRINFDTSLTLVPPKSPNITKVFRFRTYDGQWQQNGAPDAISFMCSNPIVLYGIEIFGSAKEVETYILDLVLFDDMDDEVRQNEARVMTDTIRKTYEVMFARPIRIPPRRIFTVLVMIKGSPTNKGVDGTVLHAVDGVTFEFINSKRSFNGTDLSIGQIPTLLFNKTE